MARYLNTIENINSALSMVRNNKAVRPEVFYSQILLDTITLPAEDYVHVQHATRTIEADPTREKVRLTRLGAWTAHTEVLKEGIPPRPDQTRSESIEFGYTQFGRFAYFTDQIRTDVIQDFVAHYSKQLSDLANATIEKYAREKLLSSPNEYYASGREGMHELLPGDKIDIADLRLLVLMAQRMFVNPINGAYNYICSPEFIYDLLEDTYIQQYMTLNQSTFNLFEGGKPFNLFKVKYIETRYDENLAPDLDHPGEYIDEDGVYWLRLVSELNKTSIVFSVKGTNGGNVNNEVDVTDAAATPAKRAILKQYYYKDGSAIENRVYWKLNGNDYNGSSHATDFEGMYALIGGKYVALKVDDDTTSLAGDEPTIKKADLKNILAKAVELPVNRGIFTGANGLVRVIVKGQGNAEIIVKPIGSGGTNDPLNQLSSVGFKLRGIGFGFERPEAVTITYSVPSHALTTAGLSSAAILGDPRTAVHEKGHIIDDSGDKYASTAWAVSTKYVVGERVYSGTNQYVVVVDHTSDSTSINDDIAAGKLVLLGKLNVANPDDLGLDK